MSNKVRRYPIAVIFAAIHTVLVLFVWWFVSTSDDDLTGMVWIIFEFGDWPVSAILFPTSGGTGFVLSLLVLGGIWWTAIGLAVQLVAQKTVAAFRADRV